MRAEIAATMFLAWAALGLPSAHAQVATQEATSAAEGLITEGLSLRAKGKDEAALPVIARAHQIAPTPRAAAQLGFVEQALGRWADAEIHLGEALASPHDPWVMQNRALIDESAGFVRGRLGSVHLDTKAKGELLVDGRWVGPTPLAKPLRLAPGAHQIELRAPDHKPETRTVSVTAGRTSHIALTPQPWAAIPVLAVPVAPVSETSRQPAATATSSSASSASTASEPRRRWWIWAAVAGAAVAGVVAVSLAASDGPAPFPCGGAGRVCAQ